MLDCHFVLKPPSLPFPMKEEAEWEGDDDDDGGEGGGGEGGVSALRGAYT